MDPSLEKHREQLVIEVGRKLDKARMIRFEERTGFFSSTDLGRTASHYYIKYNTIEVKYVILFLWDFNFIFEPIPVVFYHRICSWFLK